MMQPQYNQSTIIMSFFFGWFMLRVGSGLRSKLTCYRHKNSFNARIRNGANESLC